MAHYGTIFFVIFHCFLLYTSAEEASQINSPAIMLTENRAAFDIGSGKIKMQVAKVDLVTNKIVDLMYLDSTPIAFSQDLTFLEDNTFSEEIQKAAIEALNALKAKAKAYNPQKYACIATEAFRKAQNGQEVAKNITQAIHMPITIISQEEESILGFLSGVAESSADSDKVVVWDIGGGSLQITTRHEEGFIGYYSCLGRIPMCNFIISQVQQNNPTYKKSPNPISISDVEKSLLLLPKVLGSMPPLLHSKIKANEGCLVGIGAHSKWLFEKTTTYTIQDVLEAIQERVNMDDSALCKRDLPAFCKTPHLILSDLILTYGIMKTFDIKKVTYCPTGAGNTTGLLISEQYWK